jgi:ClpP class serine protease
MGENKVKTKYITAFYDVFLAKYKRIEERIANKTDTKDDKVEYEKLGKVIAKLDAQDSGLVEEVGTDEELAKKILEQSIKLREQAYKLDPKLKDGK